MQLRSKTAVLILLLTSASLTGQAKVSAHALGASCATEVLEGSVTEGQGFRQQIGGGLALMLQPIHSGWIVRVVPAQATLAQVARSGYLDYAALATPPYDSVTPLSLSTDFAFRAQDAVGWNPRRFRFASTPAEFAALQRAYHSYLAHPQRGAEAQAALTALVAEAPEGVLEIVDARLVPGTADQWRMAAAVASSFADTAHSLAQPGPEGATPLGKLLSVRFRVRLAMPAGFTPDRGVRVVQHPCSAP